VEKRFTPVVNTVGSVGRLTGVEGGVRWFLGRRRPSNQQSSDLENGAEVSNKRRKMGREDMDVDRSVPHDPYPVHRQELQHRQRRSSQASIVESLPAYDEYRSPSYETAQHALVPTQNQEEPTSPGSSWQSRLVLSTSGLSVAMSEESLRSLKYCLGWLRWANEHIGKVIDALKAVLEQYDQGQTENSGTIEGSGFAKGGQLIVRSDAERSALNAKIAELKRDVLKTLKEVVDIVSKYAGGALPENARDLVRRHLTSLPQRFRLASSRNAENSRNGESGDIEVRDGANRVLVLAKEGLDMMAQVSGVLDGTIVSAEEWCERLGRSKREETQAQGRNGELEKPPMELPPMNHGNGHVNGYMGAFPDVKMA
jgi:transcriptional repressor OPI1